MNQVITESYDGAVIPFQAGDAFVNATAMCAAFGKEPYEFLRLTSTQSFVDALTEELGENPVVTRRGNFGVNRENPVSLVQGTWLHPDLALECARWLSPKFSIWCNRVIRRILSGEVMFGKSADSFPDFQDNSKLVVTKEVA